jgi:hypothetical protein
MSQTCALAIEQIEYEQEDLEMWKLSLHMQTYVIMKQVVSQVYGEDDCEDLKRINTALTMLMEYNTTCL